MFTFAAPTAFEEKKAGATFTLATFNEQKKENSIAPAAKALEGATSGLRNAKERLAIKATNTFDRLRELKDDAKREEKRLHLQRKRIPTTKQIETKLDDMSPERFQVLVKDALSQGADFNLPQLENLVNYVRANRLALEKAHAENREEDARKAMVQLCQWTQALRRFHTADRESMHLVNNAMIGLRVVPDLLALFAYIEPPASLSPENKSPCMNALWIFQNVTADEDSTLPTMFLLQSGILERIFCLTEQLMADEKYSIVRVELLDVILTTMRHILTDAAAFDVKWLEPILAPRAGFKGASFADFLMELVRNGNKLNLVVSHISEAMLGLVCLIERLCDVNPLFVLNDFVVKKVIPLAFTALSIYNGFSAVMSSAVELLEKIMSTARALSKRESQELLGCICKELFARDGAHMRNLLQVLCKVESTAEMEEHNEGVSVAVLKLSVTIIKSVELIEYRTGLMQIGFIETIGRMISKRLIYDPRLRLFSCKLHEAVHIAALQAMTELLACMSHKKMLELMLRADIVRLAAAGLQKQEMMLAVNAIAFLQNLSVLYMGPFKSVGDVGFEADADVCKVLVELLQSMPLLALMVRALAVVSVPLTRCIALRCIRNFLFIGRYRTTPKRSDGKSIVKHMLDDVQYSDLLRSMIYAKDEDSTVRTIAEECMNEFWPEPEERKKDLSKLQSSALSRRAGAAPASSEWDF